jgi:hypothetical protein
MLPVKPLTSDDIEKLHRKLDELYYMDYQETFKREKRIVEERKIIVTDMAYYNQILKRGYW